MAGKNTLPPEVRKRMILQVAYELALSKGFSSLNRAAICKKANISPALLTHYFYLDEIKMHVLRRAQKENLMHRVIKK